MRPSPSSCNPYNLLPSKESLHYTNRRLLLITSRVDSVTKASDFRRMPDDLTLQQGLELLLAQDPMRAAVPRSGTTP